MRARKLAVALDEPPPPDDALDDYVEPDLAAITSDDPEPIGRLCLACGGDGDLPDGCDHDEVARLDAPSRAVHEARGRLRRAAAEHRAAARALRVLVLSEVARDRGDLETKPAPRPEPCPRCLIRDAEIAAQSSAPPKPVKRRSKGDEGQQGLLFKGQGTSGDSR